MFSVQYKELRFNHLTPLLVVTMPYACWFLWRVDYVEDFKWCLHLQFGVAFWRVVLREVYFEGPNRVWRAFKISILNTNCITRWQEDHVVEERGICINCLQKITITTFLCRGLLPSSTRAPLLPLPPQTCWTMLVDNVGLKACLLGTPCSFWPPFPWCKLKWFWDKFNNQSHILQGLGTTSWSMV